MSNTTVHVKITKPTSTGINQGLPLVQSWRPNRRHIVDDVELVLPHGFDVFLDEDGEASFPVEATGIDPLTTDYIWLVDTPGEDPRAVLVPVSDDPVEFATELIDVDPVTFDPSVPAPAAWSVALDVLTTVVDGKASETDVIPAVTDLAPIVYGNSLADERTGGVVPDIVPTAAEMWPNRVAAALGLPAPRNYAVGGTRSLDLLFGLLSPNPAPGCATPRAGAQWAGVAANGDALVFLEDMGNDISHFLGAGSPVAISGGGGDRYLAAMQNIREAIYAVLSSQDVIQVQTGAPGVTFGSGWLDKNLTVDYVRGGKVAYTWTATEYVDVVIPADKIAQSGPLAGKVFAGLIQYDPGTFGNAPVDVLVDGVLQKTWTPPSWEVNGAANTSYGGTMVDLPVDGADHTLRLRHAGVTGVDLITVNAIFCMSSTPPTIFAKDGGIGIRVGTYIPTPASLTTWFANRYLITPRALAAVAKYPNVHWTPTTVPAGLTANDGLHPGSKGMERHAIDTLAAMRPVLAARQPFRVQLV